MTGVQTCALPICFPVTIDYGELQKYRQELSELLERPESTLEAKAPRDFIRYASGFYKEFYDGQVNRQGNYVTHC